MKRIESSSCLSRHRDRGRLASAGLLAAAIMLTGACSSDKGSKEPTVSVQVAPVEKTTIQHVIRAQAILFPRQQAAIVPKISAPVQKFLVKRGSALREANQVHRQDPSRPPRQISPRSSQTGGHACSL